MSHLRHKHSAEVFRHSVTQDGELAEETGLIATNLRAITVADAEGGVSIRIHVECAHCGYPQHVSRAQQGHFATCKQCDQPFYIDSAGKTHTSKPVAEMDWTPEISKDHNPDNPDWEWPDKWTRPAWIGGITILALPVLWLTVWLVMFLFQPPTDLKDLGGYLGEAIVDGNLRRVLAVTQPGAETAAEQWFRERRSGTWVRHMENGGEVQMESVVVFENRDSKYARVNIGIRELPAEGLVSKKLPETRFTTFWQLDEQEQWLLAPQHLLSAGD